MIVDKFILALEAQLALKDVSISVSTPARAWLAEQGFDPEMGARPMQRVIQNKIKRPLADDLLFGELVQYHLMRRLPSNRIVEELSQCI